MSTNLISIREQYAMVLKQMSIDETKKYHRERIERLCLESQKRNEQL